MEVFYLAEGKDSSWTYDAKGNRITSSERLCNNHSSKTVEYYANSDLIRKYGDWYFSYDNNGNLTSRGTSAAWNDANGTYDYSSSDGELWLYEYDLSNRMTRVMFSENGKNGLKNKASYTYDYRGLLVRKVTEDYVEYREYTLDGKLLFREKGDEITDYIYKSNTIFAEIRKEGSSEAVYYHHTDHLGTTDVITDSNGTVVWEAEYEAFGSVLNQNGTKVFTASFTGKMYDAEAGMYYFNARWYDSEIGRFITEDPARDGIDWYAYCNNNPLRFVDPTGLNPDNNEQTNYNLSVDNDKSQFKNGYGANYDLIMQELQKEDLNKGISFDFIFRHTVFNENNPLNQLAFDKALGIESNSKTTQSCQTVALINGYAVLSPKGILGQSVLNVFSKNNEGPFGSYLNLDGSPKNLFGISNDLATELQLNQKIIPSNDKMKVNLLANLNVGAIVGLSKDGINDTHFIFKNWRITVDSLNPNRPAAKKYKENTYRILSLEDVE